jgi:hypothetical protein
MTIGRQSKHKRRVTLALKWFHLDHLTIPEVQERLYEEGIESHHGDGPYFSERTIKKWINSKPSEEVLEQVRDKHADAREQIADRHEDLYRRARSAEKQTTEDEFVPGLVPVEDKVDGRRASAKEIPYSWEVVEPGDPIPDSAPVGADPEIDTIIRITDGYEVVQPGVKYPKRDWKGQPVYTKEVVGIERDIPDRTGRSFLRQEQSSHLRQKGDALGIYEEEITLSGELDINTEVSVPDQVIQAVIEASQTNLAGEGQEDTDT